MGLVGRVTSNSGDRAWGPSVFGPVQLLQLAVILPGTVGAYRAFPDLQNGLNGRGKGKEKWREWEKQ